jgi:hydroxyacylglutathione hydrolase
MIHTKSFVFNSFEENTYVLYDDSGDCIIIDPGCHLEYEEEELTSFIEEKRLKPVRLLNTHCHIDHILGNHFVFKKYGLKPEIHPEESRVLQSSVYVSQMYGIQLNPSPEPEKFFQEGDVIKFGNSTLEIIYTPGHSPGSVCFIHRGQGIIIGGDVLFEGSIGRTDLPGGDYEQLMQSIIEKLLPLGDHFVVYPGHGNHTTLGNEKKFNPFLREHLQN